MSITEIHDLEDYLCVLDHARANTGGFYSTAWRTHRLAKPVPYLYSTRKQSKITLAPAPWEDGNE